MHPKEKQPNKMRASFSSLLWDLQQLSSRNTNYGFNWNQLWLL